MDEQTDGRTDGGDCITSLTNEIGDNDNDDDDDSKNNDDDYMMLTSVQTSKTIWQQAASAPQTHFCIVPK